MKHKLLFLIISLGTIFTAFAEENKFHIFKDLGAYKIYDETKVLPAKILHDLIKENPEYSVYSVKFTEVIAQKNAFHSKLIYDQKRRILIFMTRSENPVGNMFTWYVWNDISSEDFDNKYPWDHPKEKTKEMVSSFEKKALPITFIGHEKIPEWP